MPIQFPDFPMLTREQVSPIPGMQAGQQMMQSSMMFPQTLQAQQLANQIAAAKAKYAMPMEEQALKTQQQQYDWNPRLWKSQIGLQGAQSGLAGAETEKIKAILPYVSQQAQADLLAASIRNNLLKQILGQAAPAQVSNQAVPSNQISGQVNPSINASLINSQRQPSGNISAFNQPTNVPSNQSTSSNLNYAKAAVASNLLGLGEPKIVDINGTQTAITPFGAIPVAQGLTTSQQAFQQGLGKASADAYGTNIQAYTGAQRQNLALDNLINVVNNDSQFRNVTGPIGNVLTKWTGTPEARQTLGDIMTSSGEVTLQIAPSLKGAFTGRDQSLVNNIKANANDFPDVFIGKLKAQKLINSVLMKRAEIANQLIKNNVDPIEAQKQAAQQTPLDDYRRQINQLVNPVKQGFVRMFKNNKEYHIPQDRAQDAQIQGYAYG